MQEEGALFFWVSLVAWVFARGLGSCWFPFFPRFLRHRPSIVKGAHLDEGGELGEEL